MFSPFLSYYKCVHGSIVSAEQPFNGGSSDKLQTRPGLIPHMCTRAHIHTNTQIFGHLDTHVTHLIVDNAASSTVHTQTHAHRLLLRLFHPFSKEEYSHSSAGIWPSYSLAIICLSIRGNYGSDYIATSNILIRFYHFWSKSLLVHVKYALYTPENKLYDTSVNNGM